MYIFDNTFKYMIRMLYDTFLIHFYVFETDIVNE